MKTYNLEFTYFDGAEWDNVTVEIIALTKIQLMKAFLINAQWIHKSYTKKTQKELVKDLWNEHKIHIKEEILTFPIIKKSKF